jgi:hypothetical protein
MCLTNVRLVFLYASNVTEHLISSRTIRNGCGRLFAERRTRQLLRGGGSLFNSHYLTRGGAIELVQGKGEGNWNYDLSSKALAGLVEQYHRWRGACDLWRTKKVYTLACLSQLRTR